MICGHGTRDGRLCKRWCGEHGRCPHHGEPLGSLFDEVGAMLLDSPGFAAYHGELCDGGTARCQTRVMYNWAVLS